MKKKTVADTALKPLTKRRDTLLGLRDNPSAGRNGVVASVIANHPSHLRRRSKEQHEPERELRHGQIVEQLWNRLWIQRRTGLDLDDQCALDDEIRPVAPNPRAEVEQLKRHLALDPKAGVSELDGSTRR
jgi:hypothetical protein